MERVSLTPFTYEHLTDRCGDYFPLYLGGAVSTLLISGTEHGYALSNGYSRQELAQE